MLQVALRRTVTVVLMVLATLGWTSGSGAWAASTVDQSQEIGTSQGTFGYLISSTQHMAQTFTAGRTGYLDRVDLRLPIQSTFGSMQVELRPVADSGAPSTSELLDSVTVPPQASGSSGWLTIPLTTPAKITSGQRYAIVASAGGFSWTWAFSDADPYSGGSGFGREGADAAWRSSSGSGTRDDLAFRTYVEPAVDADGDGHDNVYDDCDDTAASVHPGASETYNSVDDDCDGAVDEGFSAWYADGDGDGYGAGAPTYATSKPAGQVADHTDPDDADACVPVSSGNPDADGDGVRDACDADDNDGPTGDLDGDGTTNADDPNDTDGPAGDSDADGVVNQSDNCVDVPNASQDDADHDGVGDACQPAPVGDTDSDGVSDDADNCVSVANPKQADTDSDDEGDLCEATHARSITLALTHVTVKGKQKLQMSGDLSVADTAMRCISNRRVYLERWDKNLKKWVRLGLDRTTREGHFELRVTDAGGNYRARVPSQVARYDGFRSSCSAAAATLRHTR